MPLHINFTGSVLEVREEVVTIRKEKRTIYCLDIYVEDNVPSPKYVPSPKNFSYIFTLMMNRKQFKTLNDELKDIGMQLKGSRIHVSQARLYHRVPRKYRELRKGELLLINYHIESLVARHIKEAISSGEDLKAVKEDAKTRYLQEIDIDQIKIPEIFQQVTPNKNKIALQVQYYKRYGQFKGITAVYVTKTNEIYLTDGYARYLAAKKIGLKKLLTIRERRSSILKELGLLDESSTE